MIFYFDSRLDLAEASKKTYFLVRGDSLRVTARFPSEAPELGTLEFALFVRGQYGAGTKPVALANVAEFEKAVEGKYVFWSGILHLNTDDLLALIGDDSYIILAGEWEFKYADKEGNILTHTPDKVDVKMSNDYIRQDVPTPIPPAPEYATERFVEVVLQDFVSAATEAALGEMKAEIQDLVNRAEDVQREIDEVSGFVLQWSQEAQQFALNASVSANAAALSADQARRDLDAMLGIEQRIYGIQKVVSDYAFQAESAAESAASSASSAAESEEIATTAAVAAKASQVSARTSENNAATSAARSQASAETAAGWNATAASNATRATDAATNAAASASTASNAATSASNSVTLATNAKTAAELAQAGAEASAEIARQAAAVAKPVITIGAVQTLPAGSQAYVTATFIPATYTTRLDFGIPKGADGSGGGGGITPEQLAAAITAHNTDPSAHSTAMAKKLDVTVAASTYATKTELGQKLDSTTAASTYLTKTDATNTYLTKTTASSTYATKYEVSDKQDLIHWENKDGSTANTDVINYIELREATAGRSYLKATQTSVSRMSLVIVPGADEVVKSDLAPYLTTASASSTYLSKTDAANTYLTKTTASSTYLTKTDASTTYLTITNANATYYSKAEVDALIDAYIPIGVIIPFAGDIVPDNYLEVDGSTISRSVPRYNALVLARPRLFESITSTQAKLIDARAEFLRFYDHGRGVDSGRVLGSSQGDAIRNLTGMLQTMGVLQGNGGTIKSTGCFSSSTKTGLYFPFSTSSTTSWFSEIQANVNATGNVPTASENRPRNVALTAIVRY